MKLYQKIALYGSGSIFLIIGLLISGFWRHVYEHLVAERLIISNRTDSQTFEMWSRGGAEMYFRIYLFNWTNHNASLTNNEKPHFAEVGPYVYKFIGIKENIRWNENDTITFTSRREWIFDSELSNGTEADNITNVNVIAVIVADKIKYFNKMARLALNEFLKFNEKNMYITKTVKEWLFEGYEDKLLNIASKVKKFIPRLKFLPDRFGWYYLKNTTSENNVFNFYTGGSGVDKFGLLNSWNYSSRVSAFEGQCGRVDGSIGDLWPMNSAQQDSVSLFISDFCSGFKLHRVGPRVVHDVDGVQFEGTELTFDNGTRDRENRCYCANNECIMKSGTRNETNCLNAPLFVSFPHFYAADSSYRDTMTGMNPDEKKHKFYLTFQKDSSLVVDVAARLQVNLLVNHIEDMEFVNSMPAGYVPAFWFEQTVIWPISVIDRLKLIFNTVPMWLAIGGLLFVILGSILLVIALILSRLSYQPIPYTLTDE